MKQFILTLAGFIILCGSVKSQSNTFFTKYHTQSEVSDYLVQVQKKNPELSKLHLIGKSWSGIPVNLLEIGGEISAQKKSKPAVFIAANFEGSNPLSTEGALFLISELIKNPEYTKELNWYILPLGNPEALQNYFTSPKEVNSRNHRPFNDDLDNLVDEDPCDDLNGDGLITQMRVKDPDGTYIEDSTDSRRLRRADVSKDEKGIYKIYTEGIDNDQDGNYNEDGLGGTNNGITFPHLYPQHGKESGRWPGEEDEIYGVFKFVNEHPDIALVMYYGQSNFCFKVPQSGRKGETNLSSLKIPRRYAGMLNADPEKTYTMAEVKELVKEIVPPGTTVDDSMIAGMLGLGAVVNPLPKDLKLYEEFSKEYKSYLKKAEFPIERLDPQPAKDGSFELWVYYHLGLPSFSMDFWGLPILEKQSKDTTKTNEKLEKTAAAGPPAGKSGQSKKPNAEETFLAYNDSMLGGKGFVNWESYKHPQLGEVEIGGIVPFANMLPAEDQIQKLLEVQVPWIFELTKKIPRIDIENKRITPVDEGIYRIEIWIRNTGELPFPMEMGTRNGSPPPAIVLIEGKNLEFLEGKARTPVTGLEAGSGKKLTWIVKAGKGNNLSVKVEAVNAYGSQMQIQMGGTK